MRNSVAYTQNGKEYKVLMVYLGNLVFERPFLALYSAKENWPCK